MMLAAIETFWFAVIWVALVLYFGLAVAVVLGGANDIRRLFRALRQEPGRTRDRDPTDPPSPA